MSVDTLNAELATLRDVLDNPDRFGRESHLARRHGVEHEAFAALDRVKAELSRLRREVEIAAEDHVIAERHNLKRAEAAEARCARLQQVVDAAREVSRIEATGVLPDFMPLAEALAGLDTPAECAEHGQQRYSGCPVCVDLVERPGGERDRLRGDTPADSQEYKHERP